MIATDYGETDWTTKEVAAATGACQTRATRKLRTFEGQLHFLLRASRALDPTARPCDLAESIVAAMDTGGRLAAFDRSRLKARAVELLAQQSE